MTKPNTELNFDFPDIRDALYSGHTFEEIREIYLKNLQESDSIYNKFYANALLRAENLLSPNHLYEFEEIVFDSALCRDGVLRCCSGADYHQKGKNR